MRMLWPWICAFGTAILPLTTVTCFNIQTRALILLNRLNHRRVSPLANGSLDNLGYVRAVHEDPTTTTALFASNLPSAYPPGTPAGLRGEAVRSALRSSRCIGWTNFENTPLEFGLLQLDGQCRNFLQNKLTSTFREGEFHQSCLLTAKGRVVDRLGVALTSTSSSSQQQQQQAYVITSPGHSVTQLFDKLDPFIFPLDKITLQVCTATIFTLASLKQSNLQVAVDKFVLPVLRGVDAGVNRLPLPTEDQCILTFINNNPLLMVPSLFFTNTHIQTVTFCFLHDNAALGHRIWESLIAENNADGPIAIGALEYETLRIQCGVPAFGKELTGAYRNASITTPASPLEVHLQHTIDTTKGCFMGQEGVAAMIKNPRGPPRTLYHVFFHHDDEFNVYDDEEDDDDEDDDSNESNLMRLPRPGDKLYALGSNQEILVGTITSVADPAGTGERVTMALALIRRAYSILQQMKDKGIGIAKQATVVEGEKEDDDDVDDFLLPVPEDALNGLEVIVGETFTVGTLQAIPKQVVRPRRAQPNTSDSVNEPDADDADELNEAALARAVAEAEKAQAEAEVAAAEAKRKAEKMEQLRRRAEEAMARRAKTKKSMEG